MCGINGAFTFRSAGSRNSNFEISASYLTRMRDAMVHRGPDGGEIWISPSRDVGFGHRRLSVIDLTASANQPMTNDDSSIVLTFNGEIYNHAEIRRELNTLKKIAWKTDHSDTEVILRAYEQWGTECVHRFRGMFAIGLWDKRTDNLWLVRDRIGVKPLYYSIHNDRVVFASEIKALLRDPDQKRAVDEESLYHYLSFLTTPAPNTLFEGIKKVPGGSWVKINRKGAVDSKRYWDVWDHTQSLGDLSEAEIAKRILEELKVSVELRKVSDVPVGVFLSGGIDSSTNAALFSKDASHPLHTFSLGYKGDNATYQNELHFAREVAERLKANHHEILLDADDLLRFLPEMTHLQDEPIADPVCVPIFYLSKLARDNGVVVCQVGEGADELYWGYGSWKIKLRLQEMDNWPIPRFIKKAGLLLLRLAGQSHTLGYEFLRRGCAKQPVFWGGAESFTETEKKWLLSPRLREKFKNYSSWEALRPMYERFQKNAWEKSPLNWMTYLDLCLRLPELLLMRVDKMSMGVSLEGRVPFLDHKFVELAMSIPSAVKTRDGVSKYILKKAVRGVIPDRIIDRKKQGFGVPVYDFLSGELGSRMDTELREFCEKSGLLDWAHVEKMLRPNRGSPQKGWYLFNLALWWKHFIIGDGTLADRDWVMPANAYAREIRSLNQETVWEKPH